MLGIVFALLCAVFIALFQILSKKSYEELPPSISFFFDALWGLVLWVPLALFMGISAGVDWKTAFMFALVSAILSEAIFFYALSKGELAVTATVLATYPVYTIIFSRFFNHEILSLGMFIFVCLAIIGSIIASAPNKVLKDELRLRKETVWPFIAAVCIGLSDTLSKGYINASGDFSFLFSLALIQIPVALAYLKLEKQPFLSSIRKMTENISHYKYAVVGSICNIIGTGFLWLSFSFAPASIASPLTGINGALTVILSRIFLKEKIARKKYLGIIIAFIGVIGIAILRAD